MAVVERRRFRFQFLVGTLLTVLAVSADWGGWLRAVEQFLDDRRARHCQYFQKPPAPPVHMDIDAVALDGIGSWPWERQKMALIVEELYAAGAKVVSLDILYEEPKPVEDEKLGAALAKSPNTIVGVELDAPAGGTSDPIWQGLVRELLADLELPIEAAQLHLAQAGLHFGGSISEFESRFADAREDAMFQRIRAEVRNGVRDPETLRHKLLPKSAGSALSPILKLFDKQLDRVLRVQVMERFLRPTPTDAPVALSRMNRQPPSLPIIQGAAGCGFVYYEADSDGVVRTVPLWIQVDGQLIPQLGLATACQMLGVSPSKLKLSANSVVIPRDPPEHDIVIPVSERSFGSDRFVQYCMDVPLIGKTNSWETMYDWPDHKQTKNHISAWAAYQIADLREKMANNDVEADKAIADVLGQTDPDIADAYAAKSPADRAAVRPSMIAKSITAIPDKLEELKVVKDLPPQMVINLQKLNAAPRAFANYQTQQAKLQVQLDQDRDFLSRSVKDRAVMFGWIATGSRDFVTTALDKRCPGVVLHGAIYSAIMSGQMFRQAPLAYTWIITLLIGILSTLAVARLSPYLSVAFVAMLAAVYSVMNGLLFFDYFHLILGLAGPLTAALVVWSGLTLVRVITEIGERGRITRRFQSYVDPTLVNFVLENPDRASFEGEEQELTVVFTDLKGFTTLSEKLGVRTVKVLSKYMEAMVPVIRSNNGYVNKFLGDGIMCFFGAPRENPNHACDAVAAVLAMRVALEKFNEGLTAEGLPTLAMRAGISTGKMMVGDAGPSFASDYTVLGDRVNLSARLESANKATGTATLVTERTVELAGKEFLFRPVAALQVVGKDESEMTYEVLGDLARADDRQRRLAELTGMVMNAFKGRDFAGCCQAIKTMETEFGESKLMHLYEAQCTEFIATPPPPDWAGQIVLRDK